MFSRSGAVVIVLAAVLSGPGVAEGQDTSHTIDQVSWIAGCWERARGSVVTEERWGAPRGGMMVGTSQTVRAGETVEYEFLRVFERDGQLVYEAHPSGQATNEFASAVVTDSTATFTNPQHDFPQEIAYRRAEPDSLIAWVSGPSGGETRSIEFAFARVICDQS